MKEARVILQWGEYPDISEDDYSFRGMKVLSARTEVQDKEGKWQKIAHAQQAITEQLLDQANNGVIVREVVGELLRELEIVHAQYTEQVDASFVYCHSSRPESILREVEKRGKNVQHQGTVGK